jgi:hypothetical protein
MKNFSIL